MASSISIFCQITVFEFQYTVSPFIHARASSIALCIWLGVAEKRCMTHWIDTCFIVCVSTLRIHTEKIRQNFICVIKMHNTPAPFRICLFLAIGARVGIASTSTVALFSTVVFWHHFFHLVLKSLRRIQSLFAVATHRRSPYIFICSCFLPTCM